MVDISKKFTEENLTFAFVFLLAAALVLVPDISYAQTPTAIESTLCIVLDQLAGPVGRAFAAIAVVFLGFSLFLGKITWGLAIALAIGIAAIFGAPEIVNLLGGEEDACA